VKVDYIPHPDDGNVLAGVDKRNTSLVRSRRKPN